MPKLSMSVYYHLSIVAVFLGLLFFSRMMWNKNEVLTEANTKITLVYEEKVRALQTCSSGVVALKKKDDELTKNAKVAVEEAKKSAKVDYKSSSDTLFKKPKAPVITKANVQDYGGEDTMVQLKDYLATQKLVNDLIDEKVKK